MFTHFMDYDYENSMGILFLFTSPCLSPIVLIFVSMGDYIARKTRLKKHRLDHRTTAKKTQVDAYGGGEDTMLAASK